MIPAGNFGAAKRGDMQSDDHPVRRSWQRRRLLDRVAERIAGLAGGRAMLVGIDGVDGAGKTVFADELAEVLQSRRMPVVRASVDGFHNPRTVRYRRGRSSPEGFFLDSYDYPAMRELLLEPLRPEGSRQIVRAVYDVATEQPVQADLETVAEDSVLVFDGIFLHRTELRDDWDVSAFLDVGFEVSIPRGAARGYGDPDPAAASNRRYVEGQRLYLARCKPYQHATFVIDNEDLDAPTLVHER